MDGVAEHRGEAGGGGVVEDVGAVVALAGGALDDRTGVTAWQHRHAEQGEAAASGEPLVVAVAPAAGAEELAVSDAGPRGTDAQHARCTALMDNSAVSSPFWQHVAPP